MPPGGAVTVRYPREGRGIRETEHVFDLIDRSIGRYARHFTKAGAARLADVYNQAARRRGACPAWDIGGRLLGHPSLIGLVCRARFLSKLTAT